MTRHYEVLDLRYPFDGNTQHLSPVVLFGARDVVLVDCGYPGSLSLLEQELLAHGVTPSTLTKLVLTHQDDDHMGAAAELKAAYPRLQILASREEAPYIAGERKNLRLAQAEALQEQLPEEEKAFGAQFCARYRSLPPVGVDGLLQGGDRFDWGGGCEIVATPGHMPGHISIRSLSGEWIVTGDAAVKKGDGLILANPESCLDLAGAEASFEKLLSFPCRRYFCFHGGVLEQTSKHKTSV